MEENIKPEFCIYRGKDLSFFYLTYDHKHLFPDIVIETILENDGKQLLRDAYNNQELKFEYIENIKENEDNFITIEDLLKLVRGDQKLYSKYSGKLTISAYNYLKENVTENIHYDRDTAVGIDSSGIEVEEEAEITTN